MPSETDVAPIPFHYNPLIFCAQAKAASLIFSFSFKPPFLHCSASLVTHLKTHICPKADKIFPPCLCVSCVPDRVQFSRVCAMVTIPPSRFCPCPHPPIVGKHSPVPKWTGGAS